MNQMPEVQKDTADEILRQAKDFYHKIKSVHDSADYSQSYQLGHIWESSSHHMREMLSIIDSPTNAVDTIRLIQNTSVFPVKAPEQIREKLVDWYIAYLMRCGHDISKLDITFQESPVTDPAICTSRAGRLLTPDFLRTVIQSLEIQKYCSIPKSKFRIVELGGGCGYLARTLKLFVPNSVYVAIDVPETLYFASIYLRLNFPQAKTCCVTDPSQLGDGIQEFDFVFIPTMFADCIVDHEFDLFCNIASLGEMTNPVIRYWMHFVQNRLKVKYLFGLNRFLNTISLYDQYGQRRLDENECSVLFDASWKILHWELEPPFYRCPYEEPLPSRNLEIVAERLPEGFTNESDNQLLSRQIVDELMDESWARYSNRGLHGYMLSNVLANDLTMNGTLFKLWNSIRLYPNKTNVAMMIIYLHTLTKTLCPFEEWFYYKDLLRSGALENATLYPGVTLLDEKYGRVWEHALALLTRYDKLNISVSIPPFMRPFLIKIARPVYIRLRGVMKKLSRARLFQITYSLY